MRVDPDACRDPDLLAAEVRRLQAVIDSGGAALTDEERAVIEVCATHWQAAPASKILRGLLERLG